MKVLIIGFGPLGARLAENLLDDDRFELKAIVDSDPTKAGQNFGDLKIENNLEKVLAESKFDIAFVVTSSLVEKIKDTIFCLAQSQVSVISSCEELIFPLLSHPDLSKEIDEQAKAHGIRVLGTGINPGFLMDYFISALAKPFLKPRKVTYIRNINTNFRRSSFQNKVGLNMTPSDFEAKKTAGFIGHVGFRQSVDMISHYFSWDLLNYTETLEPVIKEGLVKGIDQKALCLFHGDRTIELNFTAVENLEDHDKIILEFETITKPVVIDIPSGINGETGTVSMLMNTAAKLLTLSPGLKTMLDL
jgi:4-hydroxy-tetrahydrodipicolinate reductase